MSRANLVTDGVRAARVFGKVLSGELSVADVLLGRREAPDATCESEPSTSPAPRCEKEPGCVGRPGHVGGCTFDAVEEKETSET
ncbi:MAG: hypothetical protein M3O46_19905 [Myxococcota bacterium]|nr:hypothetical protein [Myxococcota bacterium]